MSTATVPCTFCATLNRVNLERIGDKPKCGHCGRPILLDRPMRLTDETFDRVIGDAGVDVLVDFYADWCAPCKVMAPALDEVAYEHQGRVLVAKLDTIAEARQSIFGQGDRLGILIDPDHTKRRFRFKQRFRMTAKAQGRINEDFTRLWSKQLYGFGKQD